VNKTPQAIFIFLVSVYFLPGKGGWAADLEDQEDQPAKEVVVSEENVPVSSEASPEQLLRQALREAGIQSDKKIRQGDVLAIHVYPQEPLGGTRTVDQDGYIFFAHLGRVKAAGLTTDDLEQRLTDSLEKDYLQNTQVFVEKASSSIERWMGWWKEAIVKPVNVMGEVASPGTFYNPREDITLMEAVSTRSGFTREADLKQVRLTRIVEGEKKTFVINAKEIIDGKADDITLKRGDTIFVPRRSKATISVLGEVSHLTGPVPMYEDGGISLMEAISTVHGFTRSADISGIRITRTSEGKIETFVVNASDIIQGNAPDIPLKQGDIVFVPQGGKLINLLGEVRNPGPINISLFGDKMTLIQAISSAGGFTGRAAQNGVRIVRIVDGKEKTIKIKAGKILKAKEKDFVLEPGDVIVVPEAFW
jgi:polysaccharide export outer membrane protein